MNPNTGQVYRGDTIALAQQRGEPLVAISEQAADRLESGYAALNREERRRRDRQARRQQKTKTSV